MSKGYTYIIRRDYGFAPNPFGGVCTLATCKPAIRKNAVPGDYIFGISPKDLGNKLVYAMRVHEKMTFNEYWNDERFQSKKPIMNGTPKTAYGDNIYYLVDPKHNTWHQSDSHHSYEGGVINKTNLNRDTSSNAVLIAYEFFYFGSTIRDVPKEFETILTKTGDKHYPLGIGHKPLSEEECIPIWEWLKAEYSYGIKDFPLLFKKGFERYDGN